MSYLYSIDPIWWALIVSGIVTIFAIWLISGDLKEARKRKQEQLNRAFHRNEGGEG